MPNNAPHNALRAAVNRAIAEGKPVIVDQPAKAHGANFSREGYDGTLFSDFYVTRDPSSGPGWFIFGRDKKKYGVKADGKGAYVMLCGFVREGGARNYNGRVRIGWRTKRDAQAWLAAHLAAYPFLNQPAGV